MKYILKSKNEMVTCLYRAGKDLVKTEIPESEAYRIIERGKVTIESDSDYPIQVGDWCFAGEIIKPKKRGK